jgi:hypothetical protein
MQVPGKKLNYRSDFSQSFAFAPALGRQRIASRSGVNFLFVRRPAKGSRVRNYLAWRLGSKLLEKPVFDGQTVAPSC